MRTQVGIVGAGPAGLLLAHLLEREGIESVVLEDRSRRYVEERVRAGLLEQGTADVLERSGVGERMRREGLVHHGIELRFDGASHRIAITDLTGRSIMIYGQQEVVKDLIAARLACGGPILFEVSDVALEGLDAGSPAISATQAGTRIRIECDYIAGCDGTHGVCRGFIPDGVLTHFEREYPFAWLGILAKAPPVSHELIYSRHQRGFALYTMRSPSLTRAYLQCKPDEDLAAWSDRRIWDELHVRLQGGAKRLEEGEIVLRGVTPMRSYVCEPMQYGRLFLAGDAAHIVPPTGAKGLNLAVHDICVLAQALVAAYRGERSLLERYSERCLRRVWRAEHFSWWMTSMLHRFDGDDPFQERLQLAQLEYVTGSRAAATSMAENYAGLPYEEHGR